MDSKHEKIINKLDTLGKDKAIGELIVDLINSNISVSTSINDLTALLNKSSNQSTKINRRIMFLTIFVALSAIINAVYYSYLMFCK